MSLIATSEKPVTLKTIMMIKTFDASKGFFHTFFSTLSVT